MSILKHNKLPALLGLSLLMSLSSPAAAQWPTLDMAAIKEGIQSKIELVKQSKIVTQATELGGKMNSAIGDAKSSVTKFAGDNIEKAKKKAEKLKKEKERLEKKKEKLDKLKEKADKMKEKAEKAKKAMNDAKQFKEDAMNKVNEAKQMVDDAKSTVNEAKQMAAEAKATAQGAINDAKSTVNDAKTMVNDARSTAQGAISDARATVNDVKSTASGAINDARMQVNDARGVVADVLPQDESANDSFVEDYVAAYEDSINSDSKVYEQLPAEEAISPMEADSLNNSFMENVQPLPDIAGIEGIENLQMRGAVSETMDRISVQKGLVSGAKTGLNSELPQVKTLEKAAPATVNGKVLGRRAFGREKISEVQRSAGNLKESVALSSEAAPVANKLKTLKTDKALAKPAVMRSKAVAEVKKVNAVTDTPKAVNSPKPNERLKSGFRQRAIINKEPQVLDKGAWLDKNETIKTASYQHTETLMFGAEGGLSDIPDGVVSNGDYDETIIPESLVNYCKFGVDKLNDVTMMQNCLKELIKHMSDKDSQVAAEGKAIHTKILSEAIIAAVSESMALKNAAANYGEKLDKQEEDMGSASSSRDDSGALAMTNKEMQFVINKLLSSQTTLGSVEALKLVGGIDYADFGEDDDEGGE